MFNRLSTVAPIRGRTAASTRTPRRRAAVAAGLASVALAGWPACASADDITIQFTTTNGLSGALGLDTSGFFQGSVFTDPMGNTQAMYMANSSSINFFTLAGSVEANKNSWFWTDPMGGGNLSLQASGVSGGSMSYSLTMTGGVLFSYNPYNADVVTTYLSFNLGGTNLFSGDVSNLSISNLANLTNASVGGSGSVRFVQDPYNTTISSYSFQIASVTINNSSSATPAQNPIAVYEAGGDVGHPDVLSSQGAIGSVAGSIGAAGSEAFYEFSWPGSDLFFANAAVPDADAEFELRLRYLHPVRNADRLRVARRERRLHGSVREKVSPQGNTRSVSSRTPRPTRTTRSPSTRRCPASRMPPPPSPRPGRCCSQASPASASPATGRAALERRRPEAQKASVVVSR